MINTILQQDEGVPVVVSIRPRTSNVCSSTAFVSFQKYFYIIYNFMVKGSKVNFFFSNLTDSVENL